MSLNDDRITITIETPEMPNNHVAAARTLVVLIDTLRQHGIYPNRINLDVNAIPTTTT